ncbi:MAG: hypothetical protein IJT21_10310 [Synergistaceae bacterium]|nr:hypothetical protein [Synergistaceae bacterium]
MNLGLGGSGLTTGGCGLCGNGVEGLPIAPGLTLGGTFGFTGGTGRGCTGAGLTLGGTFGLTGGCGLGCTGAGLTLGGCGAGMRLIASGGIIDVEAKLTPEKIAVITNEAAKVFNLN